MESVLNQVLQAQVTEQIGAKPYERTDERKGYRNGSYSRSLTTRVGTINLRIPCIREGQFSTELFALNQEVTGSIPVWPTIYKASNRGISRGFSFFSVLARFSCLVCKRCAGGIFLNNFNISVDIIIT